MKRYWSEICAALFLAVVINCFGGVIVYASSAEQQITDQMELTNLQSMVDEMLGEKTFSVTEAFHRLLSGEEVLSEESVREFLHSLLFYGIEREKELIVKLLLLLLLVILLKLHKQKNGNITMKTALTSIQLLNLNIILEQINH